MGQEFNYSWTLEVEPNTLCKHNGEETLCKHGAAKIKSLALPDRDFLPTTIFYFKYGDRNASFWHKKLMGIVRKNMISVIGCAKKKQNGKETIVIFTEKVTKSFGQWCTRKTLTKKVNGVALPADNLLQSMRGVLAGIYQGLMLQGHVEVELDTIFFVDGLMKVSTLNEITSTNHPIPKFVKMIRDLLGSNIPEELSFLLYLLGFHHKNDKFVGNLTKNPSLYKIPVKLDYLSEAELLVQSLTLNDKKKLVAEFNSVQTDIQPLKNKMQQIKKDPVGENWIQKIERIHQAGTFLNVLNFSQNNSTARSYKPTALDFLRYRRNVHQHKGNLSAEQLEAGLVDIWADFVPCLHEALRRLNLFCKLTDEMDNVPP